MEKNLILEVIRIHSDSTSCFSVVFRRPHNFDFEPGDWMDICFDNNPAAGVRTFSFSSSPTEPDLMITSKKGVSIFKKQLEALQPGDKVRVTQYGNSGFNLNLKNKSVCVAGGIGISPFRSMFKYIVDTNSKLESTLIYLSRSDDFPFKAALDTWSQANPSVKIHYIDSALQGRLKPETILKLAPIENGVTYFLAGPPAMVLNIENMLMKAGAKMDAIQDDAFTGY